MPKGQVSAGARAAERSMTPKGVKTAYNQQLPSPQTRLRSPTESLNDFARADRFALVHLPMIRVATSVHSLLRFAVGVRVSGSVKKRSVGSPSCGYGAVSASFWMMLRSKLEPLVRRISVMLRM
eukprot:2049642-Pleurochrysis_carterae.AAC.7